MAALVTHRVGHPPHALAAQRPAGRGGQPVRRGVVHGARVPRPVPSRAARAAAGRGTVLAGTVLGRAARAGQRERRLSADLRRLIGQPFPECHHGAQAMTAGPFRQPLGQAAPAGRGQGAADRPGQPDQRGGQQHRDDLHAAALAQSAAAARRQHRLPAPLSHWASHASPSLAGSPGWPFRQRTPGSQGCTRCTRSSAMTRPPSSDTATSSPLIQPPPARTPELRRFRREQDPRQPPHVGQDVNGHDPEPEHERRLVQEKPRARYRADDRQHHPRTQDRHGGNDNERAEHAQQRRGRPLAHVGRGPGVVPR